MSNEINGVDVHAHAVPGQFLEEMMKSKFAGVDVDLTDGKYVVTFPGGKPLRPVAGIMLHYNDRLGWMDEMELRQQIVAPWLDVHGQDLPPGSGQQWVRALNDAQAAATAETNGRVLPYATLHLADAKGAAKELERCGNELGMTCAMLPTQFPAGRLAEPQYDAVWEVAESLNMPITLHPPTVAPSMCLFGDYPEASVFGRSVDTTLAITQMIVTGVLDRFPNLKIVLVHGGGFLPWQHNRFDREAGRGEGGGMKPTDYIKKLYYDTTVMSEYALRMLFDLVGTGNVMIGSDYAAGPTDRSPEPVTAAIKRTGIDDSSMQKVLHENAEALFRTV